jgi:non-lysosomal glucosylceramidase
VSGGWRRRVGDVLADPYRSSHAEPLTDDGPVRGLPLGGLGTGSIGRDHEGRFSRWHLTPGGYRFHPSPGSWIGVQWEGEAPRALVGPGVELRPRGLAPAAAPGEYEALFPVGRFRFPEAGVREWSPVIPGRERESAWPVAFFEVTLRNESPRGRWGTCCVAFELPVEEPFLAGSVRLEARGSVAAARGEGCSFALGVLGVGGAAAPLAGDAAYDALGEGVWDGVPVAPAPSRVETGDRPGLAAAARFRLAPGAEATAVFALAWDLPEIRFGASGEHRWWRAHTRAFGRTGGAASRIVESALAAHDELSAAVEGWHASLRERLRGWGAPDWLHAALCNELYVLVEGGTAWVLDDRGGEHFGTLECVDYRFYETLDVRYYSSFALLELWPRLERLVTADFLRFLGEEDPRQVEVQWRPGRLMPRKVAHAAPHDLGGPDGDPFRRSNAYTFQDSTEWRDLNPKLVLLAARNAILLGDERGAGAARAAWPACREAIRYLEAFDGDGDGIPENGGVPDQTYDRWTMSGISAYCGDLWLSCLAAGEWLARQAGDGEEAARLSEVRERAAAALEAALWTGTHYRFDGSGRPVSDTVITDQLAGSWYALLLGLPLPHGQDRMHRALTTVLDSNLRGYAGGRIGLVNGRSPDGGPSDGPRDQADEVWVGVAWGVASLCLLLGRDEDAWELGSALHRTLYEQSGLWFRTPEAWKEDRTFRAAVYQRPLAVWGLYTALRVRAARR